MNGASGTMVEERQCCGITLKSTDKTDCNCCEINGYLASVINAFFPNNLQAIANSPTALAAEEQRAREESRPEVNSSTASVVSGMDSSFQFSLDDNTTSGVEESTVAESTTVGTSLANTDNATILTGTEKETDATITVVSSDGLASTTAADTSTALTVEPSESIALQSSYSQDFEDFVEETPAALPPVHEEEEEVEFTERAINLGI